MKKILIIIISIVLILWALIFPYDFDNPSFLKEENHIRIMTYNIKNSYQDTESFNERKLEIIKLIQKYSPDSIWLQEADPVWMDYLKENLNWYDYVWVWREDWDNRWEYTPIFNLHIVGHKPRALAREGLTLYVTLGLNPTVSTWF